MAGSALVTGAYGFVGRHVARRLEREGYFVIGIGHGAWTAAESRQWGVAEWHSADVNLQSLHTYARSPNLIVHCAGSGSVPFSVQHPAQDFDRTVGSTLAVLEFIRQTCPTATLVLPSSAGVYGHVSQMPITTASLRNPLSPYGMHKQIAEDLCRSYGNSFSVRSVIVRLFSVYGVGIRKQLLWDACMKLSSRQWSFAGTGEETRDWIHVDDAADLLNWAASHATCGAPAINGGSGVATSIRAVVELIADRIGASARPIFTGSTRAGDPQHYLADMHPVQELGWRAQVDREAAMRAYVDWFKSGGL